MGAASDEHTQVVAVAASCPHEAYWDSQAWGTRSGAGRYGCPWSPEALTVMPAMLPGDDNLILPNPNPTFLIHVSWRACYF